MTCSACKQLLVRCADAPSGWVHKASAFEHCGGPALGRYATPEQDTLWDGLRVVAS